MSEVTYEERNLLTKGIYKYEHGFIGLEELIKRFETVINKPLTFDEVIKAWEELGYRVTANKSVAHVMKGYEEVYTIDKLGLFTETKRISYEKINAINLTIRYLELKEIK